MTDDIAMDAVNVGSDNAVASSSSNMQSDAPVSNSATVEVQPKAPEKMLSQSDVNKIVGRTRQEERERMEREFARRQQGQQNSATSSASPQAQTVQQSQQGIGGMPAVDEDRVRQLYREEAERHAYEAMNNRVANDFVSKIDSAKNKYQDFDQVTEDLKIMNLPMNYVHIFNEFDNAGDMLYDLGKNPEKLGPIVPLFYDPVLAKKALRKLSESIKANEAALQHKPANQPLSQVTASPTGVDSGKSTISDLRKQPWLRG